MVVYNSESRLILLVATSRNLGFVSAKGMLMLSRGIMRILDEYLFKI